MKKTVWIFLAVLFILGGKTDLYAKNSYLREEDVLATSSELEEIKALEDEMTANMEASSGETAKDVTFHYERSVKILGTDIFSLKTDDAGVILNALDKGEHMWIVEAEMNGKWYELEIPKGSPLNEEVDFTPEEEAEIRSHEGKWFVVGYGEITDEKQSLWNKIAAQEQALEGCEQAVLIHDLPGFQYPVLLGIKDEKASLFAGIGFSYSLMSDYEEEMQIPQSKSGDSERAYGFWEMADRVEPYYHISPDMNGGGGGKGESGVRLIYIWIPAAAVIILAAAAFYWRKKGSRQTPNV